MDRTLPFLLALSVLLSVPTAAAHGHFPPPMDDCEGAFDDLCRYCSEADGGATDPARCRSNEPGAFWNVCFVWLLGDCAVSVTP